MGYEDMGSSWLDLVYAAPWTLTAQPSTIYLPNHY